MDNSKFNSDTIFLRLFPKKKDVSFPQGYPLDSFLDLCVGYRWLRNAEDGTVFSVPVKDEELLQANVRRENLFELAADNTKRLFKSRLFRIEDVIDRMLNGGKAENIYDGDERLPTDEIYVWTNEYGMFGASAMLYGDDLKRLAKRFGGSFYVLPSSVHEVLLVPDMQNFEENRLREIVCEVNGTSVDEKDFLSDSVYLYDPEKGELLQAA